MPDEFTGERVVPGQVDPDLFNEHFSRYAFARRFATARSVLDLGCGTGYGAAELAESADRVLALDISPEAIAYARGRFSGPNLTFEVANAAAARQGSFQLITAFEVIEHLEDWPGLLESARKQLTEDGLFLVSTPNKPLYAESRGAAGGNPFHVREFEFEEFADALAEKFPYMALFVQNHAAGILFARVREPNGSVSVVSAQPGPVDARQAQFFLAVCALRPLPEMEDFLWLAPSANLLRERGRHIALLNGELELKTQWMEKGREELNRRNGEYAELLRLHRALKTELEARNAWALEQNELLLQRGRRIERLQSELEASHAEWTLAAAAYERHAAELEEANRAATAWALETERRLTAEVEHRGAELVRALELLDMAERTVTERTLWAQGLDRELREWQQRYAVLRRSPWVRAGSRLRLVADRV